MNASVGTEAGAELGIRSLSACISVGEDVTVETLPSASKPTTISPHQRPYSQSVSTSTGLPAALVTTVG